MNRSSPPKYRRNNKYTIIFSSYGKSTFLGFKKQQKRAGAHLLLLLIKIVNDDTDEKVEGEEGAKDDEDDKIQIHINVNLIRWLFFHLQGNRKKSFKGNCHTEQNI